MSHIYEWVMSHAYEWVISHIRLHICKWVMSHMNESCHISMSHVTYEWDMSHINESCHISISHVTYQRVMSHMNESCHIWTSHVTYNMTHSCVTLYRWAVASAEYRDAAAQMLQSPVPLWGAGAWPPLHGRGAFGHCQRQIAGVCWSVCVREIEYEDPFLR